MIIIILSCAVIAYLYYYVIHLARYRRLINLIPGAPQIPIIGDCMIFSRLTREQLLEQLVIRFKKHGTIHKIWVFLISVIIISHPDDIKVILNNTKYNKKGEVYRFLRPWLNDGLLLSKGAKWQERRKILTPAFHFNILKDVVDVLTEEADRMVQSIKTMDSTTIENLASLMSHHTLNIISETSMGISLRNMNELEQKQYRQAIYDMGEIFAYRLSRPWMFVNILYWMTPTHRKEVKYLNILHRFTEKIIEERKQYHKATGRRYLTFENNTKDNEQETNIYYGRKKRLALLDVLILASTKNKLSNLDIREEVDTFMFEGHDTVAAALTFVILQLAEHKDIQDRVRNEVNIVLQENGGKFTMAALQSLTYLEQCLKESMRLYPSVFFIVRELDEDAKLRSHVLPVGAEVHIDIYNLHRNPEFWPNPEVFDPDRFSAEAVKKRHLFAYIPFSAGSRNCIGQRFAMMEMKTVIGVLLHNFYFEPVDRLEDIPLQPDMILRPMHPVRVNFVPI